MAGFEAAWYVHRSFADIHAWAATSAADAPRGNGKRSHGPLPSVNYAACQVLVVSLAAGTVPCDVMRP
jgi:hypothetical protein